MIKEADMIINFLIAAVLAGAPLVLATVGEIITEKSGNINLGVEGIMYIGAVASLAGAVAAEKLGLSGFGAAAVSFIARSVKRYDNISTFWIYDNIVESKPECCRTYHNNYGNRHWQLFW